MSQLNITSIKNKRGDFGPTMVGLTTVSGDLNVTGTISGDGSGITGLANTSNVRTDTLTVAGVATATTFDGNLTGNVTGNADTATALQTARNIGGVSFDGTADINLPGVNATGTQDTSGTAAGLSGSPSITVTDITATGDVSIGGTLTYEDVTNIDSVGMITARKGIQVLADGINAVGVVTATSFSGDGSNLTGVDSNTINLTASGSIADGDTVLIRTDGKVGIVTGSSGVEGKGSFYTIDTDNNQYVEGAGIGTGKVCVIYNDSGSANYSFAAVGVATGTDITFGTGVQFNTTDTYQHAITYDANADRVVVMYRADDLTNRDGQARVGTISGNSISFGTAVTFDNYTGHPSGCFDSSNNKVIICYQDGNNGNYGTGIVGTVSGNSISFNGSATAFNIADSEQHSVCFIGDSQVVDAFHNNSDNSKGYAVVGTVSGDSITFGTQVKFTDDMDVLNISCVYDDANDKVVIIYTDNSGNRKAKVGTVSGTGASGTISFGSATTFGQTSTNLTTPHMHAVFNTYIDKVVVAYRDGDNSDKGTVALGTVSGTDISFSTGFVYENDGYTDFNWPILIEGGNQNTAIAYRDYSDASNARAVVYSAPFSDTNVTAANFLGFSDGAYTDGQTATIRFAGVDDAQVGLTTGSFYYVQGNGDLGTTAGNPSVEAGVAISDTQILMKKNQ